MSQIMESYHSAEMVSGVVVVIITVSYWVLLTLPPDYEFFIAFNIPSCYLQYLNRIGLFYLALLTYLAFSSVIFFGVSSDHATHADPEVDRLTISHISNA